MASPAVQNAIRRPRAFMSMADLSHNQIVRVMKLALHLKRLGKAQNNKPFGPKNTPVKSSVHPTLKDRSIALVFNKRSTRTRVAAETATFELGGQALFLGKEDIQLGVNESPRDTATVLSSMCHGIFARVGDHSEIEELARYSRVPVVNALSSLWHPTQVLADLITIYETPALWRKPDVPLLPNSALPSLTVAYVGDSANVLHDMLVTYPRLGHRLRVASPLQYRAPKPVWDRVQELDCESGIFWTEDPKEAVKDADIVVTDTWISMGQEAEKEQRLKDFKDYQVTEQLCKEGGAAENWKFMHCLPRKQDEVDDEVFYGPRSLVFREAENRKWSMMAIFSTIFGSRDFFWEPPIYSKNKSAKPKNETESAPAELETPESQPTESK